MARTKQLNIVCTYKSTDYIINDLGFDKSPRFELYNTNAKEVVKKSNDPYDFDEYMREHIWNKDGDT